MNDIYCKILQSTANLSDLENKIESYYNNPSLTILNVNLTSSPVGGAILYSALIIYKKQALYD